MAKVVAVDQEAVTPQRVVTIGSEIQYMGSMSRRIAGSPDPIAPARNRPHIPEILGPGVVSTEPGA